MKKLLLSLSLGLLVAGGVQAQTFISENFNSQTPPSLPSGWSGTTSNWTTGAPDDIMSTNLLGASSNDAAHMMAIGYDGSPVSSGTILKLPTVNLPSSATSALIAFDISYYQVYLSADNSKVESLFLVASTNGGATWTTVQTLDANQNATWETHTVSVGAYAGQNVIFGFQYKNVNTQLVGVALDNIRLYVQSATDIAITGASPVAGSASSYAAVGSSVNITGTVFNYGNAPITSFVVKYQQGSNAPVSSTVSANIAALSSGSFTSTTPFVIPSAANFPMKVWVELPGDAYHADDTANAQVTGVAFSPAKRLVFEEATGAWCGWCPRGSAKMRDFYAQYPGAAAQIAVHDGDPMTIPDYDALIGTFISGYPSIVVDRSFVGDPGDVATLYQQYKNNFGFAEVTMGTPSVSGTSVSVPVTIKPAVEINGAKLALVVTENGVPATSDPTSWQHNYYSGGQNGTMDGYENKPDVIQDEIYDFVARSIAPSATGGTNGLPATMAAEQTYSATLSTTLDASWNTDSIKYIVMLLGPDGKILNSDYTGSTTGITNVAAGIDNATLYPNPTKGNAFLSLSIKESAKAIVSVTDITGRSVGTPIATNLNQGANTVKISTASLANGTYIVTLTTDKGNLAFKLQIAK